MSDLTMRERIALVICRKELSGALSGVDLDYRVDIEWPGYAGHAAAVLAEMATPTEAMVRAAWAEDDKHEADLRVAVGHDRAWSAMIAEARKA